MNSDIKGGGRIALETDVALEFHDHLSGVCREVNAPFGGEASGHFFFRDNWFADSGLIGAVVGFVVGLVQGVIGWFANLYDVLVGHSIIPDMVNGIIDWISKLPGKVIAFVVGLVNDFIAKAKHGLEPGEGKGFLTEAQDSTNKIIDHLKGAHLMAPQGLPRPPG